MQASFLLLNPTNSYAIEIMRAARREHGLRPVVVWLAKRDALFWRQHFPQLRTDAVLDNVYLDQTPVEELAKAVQARYSLRGVIAYQEQTIELARILCGALGLAWNDSQTLKLFRDKNSLKTHLRTHHPEIPVEVTRQVGSAEALFAGQVPTTYVLKPNDGMANQDVGFFNARTPRSDIDAYFASLGGKPAILETFLEGPEYAVNGQMDAQGKAWVLNITKYDRTPGNGKPNLYRFCCHVPRPDPAFAPLQDYATQVMQATGLRRAPFHMEIILTDKGPQLIEVAARFGGLDYVFITNAVHDQTLNAFSMATHYWLCDTAYPGPTGNWDYYDKISLVQLDGIWRHNTRLYSIEGMEQIEALPSFHAWVFKPLVGQLLRQTVDLFSIPYSFQLKDPMPLPALKQVALEAEKHLVFNRQVSLPLRLWVEGRQQADRLWRRVTLSIDRFLP
jgi:hypothetical protein